MKQPTKATYLKYGISIAFVVLCAGVYIGTRDFLGADRMGQYLILCDAFTVPGMVLLMLGCLVKLSNAGALDMISYAISYAWRRLIPGGAREEQEQYYEYVERRRENRLTGYGFLFIVGGIAMAIALVNMFLFYRLYL